MNHSLFPAFDVMQQGVYEYRVNSVDELKLRLIDVWNSLQQNVIDAANNDCDKATESMRACRWTTF